MKVLVNLVAIALSVVLMFALLHIFGCTEDMGLPELMRG